MVALEFSLKSPCVWPSFHPLPPKPLFEWGMQSKEILLNLGNDYSTCTYVVGAVKVKIYVAVVEALRRTFFKRSQKQDETQFTTKIK